VALLRGFARGPTLEATCAVAPALQLSHATSRTATPTGEGDHRAHQDQAARYLRDRRQRGHAGSGVDLEKWGADATKVGVGPGKVCITKLKTGFGTGGWQLSALKWCARVTNKSIIAEGGIRHRGDIAKSVRFGAAMVMVGSLFAGYQERASSTARCARWSVRVSSSTAAGATSRLEVGGVIEFDNICRVADAGVDTFVAGSAIFGQPDYKAVIDAMRRELVRQGPLQPEPADPFRAQAPGWFVRPLDGCKPVRDRRHLPLGNPPYARGLALRNRAHECCSGRSSWQSQHMFKTSASGKCRCVVHPSQEISCRRNLRCRPLPPLSCCRPPQSPRTSPWRPFPSLPCPMA
jgi:IMP dehydrogenase/GMP reductase